jgi:Tol biopolymer transport system component
MFKPHRIVFSALPLLMFCVTLVFLKTSSQSLPQAKLFAEGVINTDADEYGPAFTSDGKTLYFTRRVNRRDSEFIHVSQLESGKWSAPVLAPFSGKHFDKEPFVAPDGQRIFFASLRPVDGVEPKNRRDFNIWFVEKTAGGWSEPNHVGPAVNSPAYENYPSVAANGTLYFAGEREGGKGGNDLYRARLVNGKYSHVESLHELNTPNVDADPYIAPDESYLIFCSDRGGGIGSGDLYISFNRNGRWTEPKNLGATINTPDFEYTPLISPDGKRLFLSRGWGEIYHIDWKAPDPAVETDRSAVPKPGASSAAYKAFLGQYEMAEFGVMLTVTLDGDRLMVESSRGVTVELLPLSGNRFKVAGVDGQVTFVTDEKGRAPYFLGMENGREATGRKIK